MTTENQNPVPAQGPVMPSMDREGYIAQVGLLGQIVGQYRDVKGTVSQRRTLATHEALATVPAWDDVNTLPAPPVEGDTLGDLAVWVEQVNTFAEGLRDSMVSQIMARDSQSADEVAAIKATYDSQRDLVTSLATVLKAMGVDVSDVEVPVLRSPSTTSTRSAASKGMQFYRIVSGVRKDQAPSTNTLSTFAFHHASKITGTDPQGNPTGVLTKWLEANVDNNDGKFSLGKPWAVEVNGTTYGMDVAEAADDTPAEAPAEA